MPHPFADDAVKDFHRGECIVSLASMPRYRIYSETLPYEEVTRRRTLELLRRYRLEIVLAVRPWQLGELARVAATLKDEDIALSVWPMIADEDGRWASVHNAEPFFAFVCATCDALEKAGAPARDILLDLEPPFADARALADARFLRIARRAPRSDFAAAARTFARGVADLRDRGITTSSAVWPLVALDPPGASGWQSLLGTPVDALSADHVSVMMYTSIIAGWSRGAIRRRDAALLLSAACARVVRRHGDRGGISLGCVGTGAFLDEPVFRSPAELAEDAAIARASGVPSIALFDLGGVLARDPPEAWLDALVDESSVADVRASKRITAARSIARAATWALRRRR
jgi:hypothetical protein